MSFTYTKGILKISVAQICQNIGWHAVQTSPMEILIDIAHRYILELSKTVHRYSNQYGRTEPNLDDLALTFKDFNISLHEMEEYVNNVEPVPFVHKLGKFPAPHPSNLQHPKPGSKELSHRPDFIPDYMPPMHPEFDDEENVHSPNSMVDNATKKTLTEASSAGGESPMGSPKHGVKRSLEWSGDAPPSKKAKHYPEEEGRPMREVTSVFMTSSGFISPVYEGKVAEPSLPQIMDSPPSTPEPVVNSTDILPSKKELKSKDSKKEKSSKNKKDKESSKKDSKKNKSSKKEKENKENAEISSEKSGNPSFSAKKEVNSHKSSGKSEKSLKMGDSGKPKGKGDKVKQKECKDDFKKYKDSSKLYKFKSKVNKHSGMSSNSPSKAIKSPKISKSPKLSKSPKTPKTWKSEKPKSPPLPPPCPAPSPPPPPPPPMVNKEEKNFPKVEVMEERPELKMEEILAEARYRDESPESRLIIDDSIEAQARQEMESRLADLDKCIEAVIQRATVQCEVETKKTYRDMDETIDEVVRGPPLIKKQEPKDIYDFTDSSNGSRPDSPDMRNSPVTKMPVKKERSSKTPEMTVKTPPSASVVESPKKGKAKEKHKKKAVKEQKPKTLSLPKVVKETPGLFMMSPKLPKSSVPPVCVKQEEKIVVPPLSPPIKREEVESDEDSTACSSSLVTNIFGLHPPPTQRHLPAAPFSQLPPPPPFVPSSSPVVNFTSNPFQHMRLFPQHMQPTRFPTPPLFVDMPPRADMSTSFQANNNPQPLNLAKSDSNTQTKSTPEKQPSEPRSTSSQSTFSSEDVVDFRKKTEDVQQEKSKFKDHKKEKKEKEKIDKKEKLKKKSKEKKDKEKEKNKEKKEEMKEKDKDRDKPKEKLSKIKVEKLVKVEKKSKSKSDKEKKKMKEKEEKGKDDSPVPKMTLKLSSCTGAAKIFIKSSTKSASSPVPSMPQSPPPRECQDSPSPPPSPPPPSAPPRIPTPPPVPVKVTTPPPVSAPPSPPPPSPPPPPKSPTPPLPSPVEETLPPAPAPPPPPPPPPSPPPQPVISPASPTPAPAPAPAVAPTPPPPVAKATHSRSGRGRGRRAAAQQPVPPARTVITETIGTIVDESGNKIWICPTCTRPDDGSPMIGCDECDDWYHWVCVNIVVPPKEEESWFCERCITKRKTTPVKRRRKKHKRDK